MSVTKILAGAALLAATTSLSAPAFADDIPSTNDTASCVASGSTDFEKLLSVQECEVEHQQTKMAAWNNEADARKQSIDDLNNQIQSASEDQKTALQDQLTELQNGYNAQYTTLQEENREQTAKVQALIAQYKQLPPAEQRLVQLHMNKDMVQQRVTALQKLNNSVATLGADTTAAQAQAETPAAPTSATTETDATTVQPEVQTLPAPIEQPKANDTLWGAIKALFVK